MQTGSQAIQQLTIRNTSQYHLAWWTLQEVPQRAQQADATTPALTFEPQRAQHGLPAALQSKEQQLMQHLQEGQQALDSMPSASSAGADDTAKAESQTHSTVSAQAVDPEMPAALSSSIAQPVVSMSSNVGNAASSASTEAEAVQPQSNQLRPEQQKDELNSKLASQAALAPGQNGPSLPDYSNEANGKDGAEAALAQSKNSFLLPEQAVGRVAAEAGVMQDQINPFLEADAGQSSIKAGPSLQLASQCGKLAPGACVVVQVS